MSHDDKDIGARLREARKKAGFATATEAARALGVSYPTYASHENGSRGLRDKLETYGRRFGVTADYLLTGRSGTLGPAVTLPDTGTPIFAGYVNAGYWRAVDEYFQQDGVDIPEAVRRVAAYPKARQYAYKVEGRSMDAVGIADGMWIVAADYSDFVETYGELASGDLVVVRRTRFQGSERELTVKEIQYYPNRFELIPRSSDPAYQPIVVPYDHGADGDKAEVTIVGVVLSAIRDFSRRRK